MKQAKVNIVDYNYVTHPFEVSKFELLLEKIIFYSYKHRKAL